MTAKPIKPMFALRGEHVVSTRPCEDDLCALSAKKSGILYPPREMGNTERKRNSQITRHFCRLNEVTRGRCTRDATTKRQRSRRRDLHLTSSASRRNDERGWGWGDGNGIARARDDGSTAPRNPDADAERTQTPAPANRRAGTRPPPWLGEYSYWARKFVISRKRGLLGIFGCVDLRHCCLEGFRRVADDGITSTYRPQPHEAVRRRSQGVFKPLMRPGNPAENAHHSE